MSVGTDKLVEYWQANIATNYKKISAIFGSMIISVLGLTFYGIRTGLDFLSVLIVMMFQVSPFIAVLINLIFKGETDIKDHEIAQLKEQAIHEREVSEYRLQAVALRASADWNKYNDLIKEAENFGKQKEEKKELI